jgi:inner membrane protein
MIAFGVISVLMVFWIRRFYRVGVTHSDRPDLNARGRQYIGRSLMVEQAIQNGRGKVRLGDSIWQVESPDTHRTRTGHAPDTPAGVRVTVVAAGGTVLVVERANP